MITFDELPMPDREGKKFIIVIQVRIRINTSLTLR